MPSAEVVFLIANICTPSENKGVLLIQQSALYIVGL